MASPRGTGKLSKVERSYSVKTRVGLVIAAIMLLQVILVVPDSEAQDTSQTALRVNGAAMAANDVELWTKSYIELDPDVTWWAVAASPATVKDKSYPLIIPITILWNSQSRDDRIEKVVNFYASTGLL